MINTDSYIIFTSAYNEENNIKKTIESVIKQSIAPTQWIIVNDGSTDRTKEIIETYVADFPFISLVNKKNEKVDPGAHVGVNWKYGKKFIKDNNWKYIAQLDADIEIDREDFYEFQINKFREDSRLGISSGITYNFIDGKKKLTRRPYWRTGGASKFYRRKCFEDIGEILPIFAWDGLDVYKAMYHGWKSRTQFELHVNHLGKLRMLNREKDLSLAFVHGQNLYQRGFPIEFVLLKSLTFLKRSFGHFKAFYKGYWTAKDTNKSFVTRDEKKFIRKIQYRRILDKFTSEELL